MLASAAQQAPSETGEWFAGQLATVLPTFAVGTTSSQVFDYFRRHHEQVAAAVIDKDAHVVGIVNRLRFLARYAQPFIPELYGKRSIVNLANCNALVVDERLPVMELASALTLEWPDALRECFVITRNKKYFGIGTSEALVRAKLAMLAAKEAVLKDALTSAGRANAAKNNFLALMSHELRTPLNAIIGFSEVLTAELFGGHSSPKYREYASDIHRAGRHLLELINDILDLSKSEAGKLELHVEEIDLKELFGDSILLVAERAREHGVDLTTRIARDFPHLLADRLRMKQVLLNLLANSVKFTPSGGHVVLTAALEASSAIRISVIDSGIGMAPESIPVALEPFRQIDSPMSRKVEGTGLGLALVKSLVERHEGELAIESAVGLGTKVHVTLPPARTVVLLAPPPTTSVDQRAVRSRSWT